MPSAMLFERSFESWRMMLRRPVGMAVSDDHHLHSGTMTLTPSCAVLVAGVPWFAARMVRAVFHPSGRVGVSSRFFVFGRDVFSLRTSVRHAVRKSPHAGVVPRSLWITFRRKERESPPYALFRGLPAAPEAMWIIFHASPPRSASGDVFGSAGVALEPMRADDGRYVSASTISKGGNDDQKDFEAEAAAARCRQRTFRQGELRQEPSQDDGLRNTEEALTPSRVHLTSAVVALQRHGRHSSSQ